MKERLGALLASFGVAKEKFYQWREPQHAENVGDTFRETLKSTLRFAGIPVVFVGMLLFVWLDNAIANVTVTILIPLFYIVAYAQGNLDQLHMQIRDRNRDNWLHSPLEDGTITGPRF